MSRTKKIILGVIAAFVVLVIAVLAGVSLLLNPNEYKDRIASAAESALGRKVYIEGDLSLSVFPSVVIETGAIRVENPAEFGGGDFVSLKQADLNLELMPLISGSVRVNKITATDMTVLLVKDKNGRANWQFKPASERAPATDTPGAPATPAEASSGKGLDIAISSLELVNADITYRDLAQGATYQVKQFNFKGDNLKPGEEFKVVADGLLIAAKEALSAGFKAETSGEINPLTMTGNLPGISLEINAEGKGVPGGKATLAFNGALDASQGLKLVVLTIESLKAQALNATIDMAGEAQIPQDYRQARLNVSHLDADGLDGKLSFKGDISPLAMTGKGELSLSGSIKKMMAALGSPMQTQNPAALEKFELTSPVELSPALGVNLSNMSGNLDSSSFSGNLAVNPGGILGGSGKGITINSNIKLDAINVDDYLPVKGAGAAQPQAQAPEGQQPGGAADNAAGGKPAASGKPAAGASPLKTLSGKVNFNVGQLTAAKVVVSNLVGVLTMSNGLFVVDPCSFVVFKGNVNAAAKANLGNSPMPVALNMTVKGLALGEVMQFVAGEQKITGNTDLTLNITGVGDAWPALSKTLAGSGAVSVRDGLIHQIKLVPDSAAQIGIAGVAPLKPLDGKLESLTATFNGSNGRFTNNDLVVLASIANIAGQGWADLGQNSIDYDLMVATGGFNIPVMLTGSLSSPNGRIDTEKFLKSNSDQLLKGAEAIKDPEKAKELLQGIGGGVLGTGDKSGGTGTSGTGTGDTGTGTGAKSGTGGKSIQDKGKEMLDKLF